MSRLQIPYHRVLAGPSEFEPGEFDGLLRRYVGRRDAGPLIVEVFNDCSQYFLFVREGQVYWSCCRQGDSCGSLTIREFFSRIMKTQFPQVIFYSVELLLFHSLIVCLQTEPELKVASTLVDLDEILDRLEKERRSALVAAHQPGNLIMARYRDGEPVACYHDDCSARSGESNGRDDFLVKVYTRAARSPFEIRIYTDLVVTHSEDSRPVPPGHEGSVSSFFLSQPPRLVVRLKNRPLKTYNMTGGRITIGRLPENDIVIDNLGVSRKHAVITAVRPGYVIRDLGSRNGTFLNGSKVSDAPLASGDLVTIGKYEIRFSIPEGEEAAESDMDQTVIIPHYRKDRAAGASGPPRSSPKLYRRSDLEEYPIDGGRLLIGKSREADIRLKGLFAPKVTVEIRREDDGWLLQKTSGRRNVRINGECLEEKVLEEEDLIAIGSDEFVFKS